MSPQPQAKPKKQTKYRPVQRSDGVVVLQRPYRPVGSPSPVPPSFFERDLPPHDDAASMRTTHTKISLKQKNDIAGVGTHLADMGRDGYNDVQEAGREEHDDMANAGRGGYQGISVDKAKGNEDIVDFSSQIAQRGKYPTPMQRFLSEAGSWSALELRGD